LRRRLWLSALSALALASSLAIMPAAHAAFPGQNGRIAYVTTTGDHRVIYTVDAHGADPQPLIDLGSSRDAIDPTWSRDGLKVAFAGQESPGGSFVIYTANADGTGTPEQITRDEWPAGFWLSDTDPTWSPDGKSMAFVRTLTDGTAKIAKIWTVDLATGTTSLLDGLGADVVEEEPAWSPDGTRIAFAATQVTCAEPPCRFDIVLWGVDQGQLIGSLRTYPPQSMDWHHPDWSPDGTKIVARFGRDEDPPYGPSGVQLFDASSGDPLDILGPCSIMTEPSFSPDGRYVLVTSWPVSETGELGEPNLCAIATDNTDAFLLEGSPPRSDAAWGPVPGSPPPPPPDTSPPTIEFRPDPSASQWLDPAWAGYVNILASDDLSLPSIACTDNGSIMSLITGQVGSNMMKAVAKLSDGVNQLVCTATDEAGNSTTASATYRVDLTPPVIDGPFVTPTVAKVGETVSVSATVSDAGSDLWFVDFAVVGTGSDSLGGGEMSGSGSTFTASFVPARPDLSKVVVSAGDEVGFVAESAVSFVSYEPSAGSTDGTGWIVPGGPTSEPGDVLPGLDGVQKASFGFTAKYRTPSSVTPAGNLTFSYGSRFKLQSRDLSWLAVRDAHIAYLGGFASIQGMDGEFPFVAVIVDASSTASSDRFELRVYDPGTNIASPTPLFAASGDAGGQIQIRR
jgi:Tol biopolymer transport system component